ncbi:MAG: hypothetical protein NZM26_04170 [Patescibacteria group bacterium]|nr:hypothetical protein [Patescibacteria group bacterium]
MKAKNLSVKKNILIWTIVVFLAFVQVFVSMQTAFLGERLSVSNNERERLEQENNQLMAELADRYSLAKVGSISEELGFSTQKFVVFISQNETLASLW